VRSALGVEGIIADSRVAKPPSTVNKEPYLAESGFFALCVGNFSVAALRLSGWKFKGIEQSIEWDQVILSKEP
jgi:hypothetical protein